MVAWQTVNLHKVTRVEFMNYQQHYNAKFEYETVVLRIEYGEGECAVEFNLFSDVEGALKQLDGMQTVEQLRLGI